MVGVASVASGAAPTVTVDSASGVGYTTATVKGRVDPSTHETSYHFEYATEADFSDANSVGFGSVAEDAGVTPVEAELTALRPNSAYHIRLVAENEEGTASAEAGATFKTKAVAKPSVTVDPVTVFGATTATLTGNINPDAPGPAPQDRAFETSWRFVCEPECSGLTGTVEADNSAHPISAEAVGLEPETAYAVKLVAENAGGSAEAGATNFTTGGAEPAVVDSMVRSVGTETANLVATLDTANAATNYYFEYGTTTAYGLKTQEGGPLQARPRNQEVNAPLTGLLSGTRYHWRVVAINPSGPVDGPDTTFRTFAPPISGLPDGRAYEQATPVSKNGGNIQGKFSLVQAPPSGAGITSIVQGGLPGSEGAQEYPYYLSTRGADAWSTQGLLPAAASGPYGKVLGWSEDLTAAFDINKPASLATGVPFTAYLRSSVNGELTPIVAGLPGTVKYDAMSVGDEVVEFETTKALAGTPAIESVSNVYVWDRATGKVSLASVSNEEEAASEEGSVAGPYDWYNRAPTEGGARSGYFLEAEHALADDGSSLVFTTSTTPQQVYVRLNPTRAQSPLNAGGQCIDPDAACTVKISESERSTLDPEGEQPAAFISATPDNSKILFMSPEKLTDSDIGPARDGENLYSYDMKAPPGERLTDLTLDTNASDENGAEVRGVLGSSEDGSIVYFVANGVLAPGASRGNCGLGDEGGGSCNLYVSDHGRPSFIASVSAEGNSVENDSLDWTPTLYQFSEFGSNTARVTPDGSVLVFRSQLNLTSYNSERKPEFYRYELGATTPTCLTCNPTNEPPQAIPNLQSVNTAETGVTIPNSLLSRNLSRNGDMFFFETSEGLVAGDRNEVNDVYEWEADGSGTCADRSENGGCLYLLSTGESPQPSYFADAGENGEDVFLFTTEGLVGQDRDELVDIYDARVGGGLASQFPDSSAPCSGENCLTTPQMSEVGQTAGTSTFSGPGNASRPRACRRGFARKHGHCVKKKRTHKRRRRVRGRQRNHANQADGRSKDAHR